MSILTAPQRLAMMLVDCDEAVVGAYAFTQGAVDQIERSCWLIFVEDTSFPYEVNEEEDVEQSYSLAFVGQSYTQAEDSEFSQEYESLARRIAVNATKYLLEHPQMQMSNQRNLFDEALPTLTGIRGLKISSRSGVSLFSRDAVAGDSFWGFTIDISVTEMLTYEIVEIEA